MPERAEDIERVREHDLPEDTVGGRLQRYDDLKRSLREAREALAECETIVNTTSQSHAARCTRVLLLVRRTLAATPSVPPTTEERADG